jgi:hypothetical protein
VHRHAVIPQKLAGSVVAASPEQLSLVSSIGICQLLPMNKGYAEHSIFDNGLSFKLCGKE